MAAESEKSVPRDEGGTSSGQPARSSGQTGASTKATYEHESRPDGGNEGDGAEKDNAVAVSGDASKGTEADSEPVPMDIDKGPASTGGSVAANKTTTQDVQNKKIERSKSSLPAASPTPAQSKSTAPATAPPAAGALTSSANNERPQTGAAGSGAKKALAAQAAKAGAVQIQQPQPKQSVFNPAQQPLHLQQQVQFSASQPLTVSFRTPQVPAPLWTVPPPTSVNRKLGAIAPKQSAGPVPANKSSSPPNKPSSGPSKSQPQANKVDKIASQPNQKKQRRASPSNVPSPPPPATAAGAGAIPAPVLDENPNKSQRSILVDTYTPHIQPTDTSLEDARIRLRTALDQTRYLRAAFTDRIYDKYRVILRPVQPSVEDITSRIDADPEAALKDIRGGLKMIKEEKDMEKKEGQKLNAAAAGAGSAMGGADPNAAETAEQLAWFGAGLSLVVLPEEIVDDDEMDMSPYEHRGPTDPDTGHRVPGISSAAAAAAEVLLDRVRRGSILRMERKRRRKLLVSGESGVGTGGDASGRSNDAISPMHLFPSSSVGVGASARPHSRGASTSGKASKHRGGGGAKSGSLDGGVGKATSHRMKSFPSGANLLSLSPNAEEVDRQDGKKSAAVAALIACGVGSNASASRGSRAASAQQNRWRHPHPESLAGRKLSSAAGASQSSRKHSSGRLAVDTLAISPPLDAKTRKEVKPCDILPPKDATKPTATKAVEAVLRQFPVRPSPTIDGKTNPESDSTPSGQEMGAEGNATGPKSPEPSDATKTTGLDKPSGLSCKTSTKDDAERNSLRTECTVTEIGLIRGMMSASSGKNLEGSCSGSSITRTSGDAADIDPMVAFSVLHALGLVREASSPTSQAEDDVKPATSAEHTSPLFLGLDCASHDESKASKEEETLLKKMTFTELFSSGLVDQRRGGDSFDTSSETCNDAELQQTNKQEMQFESSFVPHIRGGGTEESTKGDDDDSVPSEQGGESKAANNTSSGNSKEESAEGEQDESQTARPAPSNKSELTSTEKNAVPASSIAVNATPRPASVPAIGASQTIISPSMMASLTGTPIPPSQSPFSHQQMLQMQQRKGGDALLWGEQGIGMRTDLASPRAQTVPIMVPPPVRSSSLDGAYSAMHQASMSAAARLQGQQYQASAAHHHAAAAMHGMAHGTLQQNPAVALRTSDLSEYLGNNIQHAQHGYALPPEWASLQATGLVQPHSSLAVANMGLSPHAMVNLSAQDRATRELLVREQHAAAVAAHAHAQAAAAHRHAAATACGITTGMTPLSPQQAAAFGAGAYSASPSAASFSHMGAHIAASSASAAMMARQQQQAALQGQAALNASVLQNAGSPARPLSSGAVSAGSNQPLSVGSQIEFPALAVLAPDGSVVRPPAAPANLDGVEKNAQSQGIVDMTDAGSENDSADGTAKGKTDGSPSKSVPEGTNEATSLSAADQKNAENESRQDMSQSSSTGGNPSPSLSKRKNVSSSSSPNPSGGADANASSGTTGMRFFIPPLPKGLSQEAADLIVQSRFHKAMTVCAKGKVTRRGKQSLPDADEEPPLVEYLLAVGAAVPIPKALVTNMLKEKLSASAFKGIGGTSMSLSISRDVITAAIATWLWAEHKESFQRAFAKSGRIDVDPECKWLVHAAVDTSTRALMSDLAENGSSLSPRTIDVRVAKIVSQSLMKELCIDRETDVVLANLDHLVKYLDDQRTEALKAKSQERALLAALISRRAKMSESFSHAYTSAMVRAGEAFGHETLCDIVQDEVAEASTLLPFDFFDDEVGAWEDPCRPSTGFVAGLSGEELIWRAHGRAMIQKSLKKLQDRYGIKGGTPDAGPYTDAPSSKGDSSGGTGSSSAMRSPPISRTSSGLKRKASFSTSSDAAGGLSSAAAAAKSALFNPTHYSSPLIWDCDDMENMPYGQHDIVGGRARSLSMARYGGRNKRARRSTSSTFSSPATPSPKVIDRSKKGIMRSTMEIDWHDVANMFHEVTLPGVPSTSAPSPEKTMVTTKKGPKIIAPFCEEFDYSTLDTDEDMPEESDEEEDLSDETVLARHQEVLDEMKQKLEHVMAMRQQLQERSRSRSSSGR